jgi:hypothetical protein
MKDILDCSADRLAKKDRRSGITVLVEWSNLGEGISGDYNPKDPTDINLLRFDVSYKRSGEKDWTPVNDASYCTQFPASAPKAKRMSALKLLMSEYFEPVIAYVEQGISVKKLGEKLSWISLNSLKIKKIEMKWIL